MPPLTPIFCALIHFPSSQVRFAECDEVYFIDTVPFKRFKMPGVGEIDGAGHGIEGEVIGGILAIGIFYKYE